MKRVLSILLCLLMLAALPMQALAAQGDVIIPVGEDSVLSSSIMSSCAIGDSFYMMLYEDNQLAVQRMGETQPKLYAVDFGVEVDNMRNYAEVRLMTDGSSLLALHIVSDYSGEQVAATAAVYKITLDGENAQPEKLYDLDWSIFYNEVDGYYQTPHGYLSAGGYVLMRTYDESYQEICYRMDPADGTMMLTNLINFDQMTLYIDGKALATRYTNEEMNRIAFETYDPATDVVEVISEVEVEPYDRFDGLTCDPATGKTYFVRGGELFELDIMTGAIGESITDMPVEVYYETSPVILDGGYIVATDYQAMAVRNLNPGESRGVRLKIYDSSYCSSVEQAFYQFANEHSDVSTVLSREYTEERGLIDNMMNRYSGVDVYILPASSEEFEALYDRGYIADLGGSEKIQALAERVRPELLERLSVDGNLSVIPVEFYFWVPYLNRTAMERLGLTEADFPNNWSDMLDFMKELEARMPEDRSVRMFDPWMSERYARETIFDSIFQTYQQMLSEDPNSVSVQQMVELLKKLEAIDFARLGQPTEEETNSETYMPVYDDGGYLLELNSGMTAAGITTYNTPLVLGLTQESGPILAMDTQVAFVNPFSQNPELAMAFMETLAENLNYDVNYTLFADLTEPVENEYYEEGLQSMTEWVEQLREQLAEAEEIDRQDLENALADAEENLANYDQYRYSLSEKDIAWLAEHSSEMTLRGSNWLYRGDDGGEAYEWIRQYHDGQIPAEKLMQEIDRKVRMMMMEGY